VRSWRQRATQRAHALAKLTFRYFRKGSFVRVAHFA
jgi:hypothetical protein